MPDLQAQLESAHHFGHHLENFSPSLPPSSAPMVQPKLTMGAPGDKYEREADRAAQQVVQQLQAPDPGRSLATRQGSSSEPTVQRETTPEEDEVQMKPLLQRQAGATAVDATPELETAIQQARGSGQPIVESIRQPLEQSFGNVDFRGVRLHTDSQADQLNQSIQAQAFTTGQDVFFRQGAYQPESRGGQELLAHELTHVVQQNGGAVQRSPIASPITSTAFGSLQRRSLQEQSPRPVDPATHAVNTSDLQDQINQARRTPSETIPSPTRTLVEAATDTNLSGVRVHNDESSWSLNNTIGTAAFATGQDVFFRHGTFQPDTPAGRNLIEHELHHVALPTAGQSAAQVQAAAIDDARIRTEQETKYREAADILERKLGAHLSPMQAVNDIANEMMARLRKIVDAWADATNTGREKAYEQEFVFPDGRKYYGSFQLTGKEIKKVFEKPNQPLRKKLNLVYYCVRNGNFVKYLELAANELRRTSETGRASTQNVQVAQGQVSVKKGFAKQSGLEDMWKQNLASPVGKTSKEEVEADLNKRLQDAKTDKKQPVFGQGWTGALGVGDSNSKLRRDKMYNVYTGLGLEDTQTLSRGDVGDITTAEMRLLYERQNQRQPLWISHKDKDKFKRDTNTKILWEQGGENIEVASNSKTREIAAETISRLEGGISGSTDLMMHASKHLGYTKVEDLKRIRLALVAWMLSNRDHSFFEIMKVAADYGAPFHIDKATPGAEYENPDNFYPLNPTAVDGFKNLLPGQKMPSYYMGGTYKSSVDGTLTQKGRSSDDFFNDLVLAGLTLDDTWKTDPKANDLSQWLALKAKIGGLGLKLGRTEADLKFNRIAVQRLLKEATWQHVVQTSVDPNARTNLRALLKHQFGATAVVSDPDLVNIGVPSTLITGLEEYKRYDFYRLYEAVRLAAPQMKGANSSAHTSGAQNLRASLPFQGVQAWAGDTVAELILSSMLTKVLGNTRATETEQSEATALVGYDVYKNTYKLSESTLRMKALGIPEQWLKWLEGQTNPLYAHFQLEELSKKVSSVGFVKGEPPTSKANNTARQNLNSTKEYRSLQKFLGPTQVPVLTTYLIEQKLGAKSLTSEQHDTAFKYKLPKEKVDDLTAFGVPRDVAEVATTAALDAVHQLRRAAIATSFDMTKDSTHKPNQKAWTALENSTAVQTVKSQAGFRDLAVPIAATIVRQIFGAQVLSKEVLMLATATDQRMANVDKQRLGRSQVIDTTQLETPTLKGETPATTGGEQTKREERYWATTDSDIDFKKNIGGTSPTVRAQFDAIADKLKKDSNERDQVFTKVATKLLVHVKDPKPTLEIFKSQLFPDDDLDYSVSYAIENLDPTDKLALLDPDTKSAIDAIALLSPRERGALYQYTNKLHDQMGYATQYFSMATDFGPTDVANVTTKLQSLNFMLPILQAFHSAMEKLPPYKASKVYSGRKSGANLDKLDDPGRLSWASKNYRVGQVISYAYPLSTAKDVPSSFIVKPGTDVGLEIEQPILTGKDIEYVSNKPGEKEVLFPQGARFQVVRIEAEAPSPFKTESTKNKLWVVLKEI